MLYAQEQTTLTFNGETRNVSELSPKVQALVAIHTKWKNELVDAKLKVEQVSAAIRALEQEMTAVLSAELAPDAAKEATPETPAT